MPRKIDKRTKAYKNKMKKGGSIFSKMGDAIDTLSTAKKLPGDFYNISHADSLNHKIGAISSAVMHGARIINNVANLTASGANNAITWNNYFDEYMRRHPHQSIKEATMKSMPHFKTVQQLHGAGVIDTIKDFFNRFNPFHTMKNTYNVQPQLNMRRGLAYSGSY